jgi:hypothetical protein
MTVHPTVSTPGGWTLSTPQAINSVGRVFTGPATEACKNGTVQACEAWLATQHLRQEVSYQPASRYWAFQWLETAIFLLLALALAGICFRRIRRLS